MAVDSLGFGDALAAMPEQLAAAHEVAGKVPASALPDAAAFDRIVTLGMGGSGIAGNILQAVGTATLPVPVTVLKHYRTPAFVNDRTLGVRAVVLGRHRGDRRDGAGRARRGSHAGRHLQRGRARSPGAGVGVAARALPRRHPHAAPGARRAGGARCSSCCSAWACCRRRTQDCCGRRSSSRAAATSASRRSKASAIPRASWRARSVAPSPSSTAAAGSAASPRCVGSSR